MSGELPWRQGFILLIAVMTAGFLFACERTPSDRVQGYVEGEFVYIASPFAGALESLSVSEVNQCGREMRICLGAWLGKSREG